jgi:hypothetical protein
MFAVGLWFMDDSMPVHLLGDAIVAWVQLSGL